MLRFNGDILMCSDELRLQIWKACESSVGASDSVLEGKEWDDEYMARAILNYINDPDKEINFTHPDSTRVYEFYMKIGQSSSRIYVHKWYQDKSVFTLYVGNDKLDCSNDIMIKIWSACEKKSEKN